MKLTLMNSKKHWSGILVVLSGVLAGCDGYTENSNPTVELQSNNAEANVAAETETTTSPKLVSETPACPPLAGSGDFSDLVGTYDASAETSDGFDEFFIEITEDGSFNTYDSQKDEFGGGKDCYVLSKGDTAFESTGDSTFSRMFYTGIDVNCVVQTQPDIVVTRVDDVLTFDSPDTYDRDGDGDVSERVIDEFPVLATNLSTQDFNVCPQ